MTTQTSSKDKQAKSRAFKIELPRRAFFRRQPRQSAPGPALDAQELMIRMRRFGPFRKLSGEELSSIASAATVRCYRTGEYVWRQGETARYLGFLDCGFVKLSQARRNRAPATYGLFGPGDSIGVLAMYAGMRYPTDAIALNDGLEVIRVASDTIRQISDTSLRVAAAVRDELTRFSGAFMTKIDIISAGTVPQRLATLMLHLVDRYGVDRSPLKARVPFLIPRDELAALVGVREETVVRALMPWKRRAWFDTRSSGFYIEQLDKLREIAYGRQP